MDNWFNVRVKRNCQGEAYLIRYYDDFVCCFQNKWETERFYENLIERFKKFGLELALDKTKILEFGRFARRNRAKRGLRKPETFDFLGFTFYCSENGKKEFFRCKVNTCKKKIRGHYQYYGVTDNTRGVKSYLNVVKYI